MHTMLDFRTQLHTAVQRQFAISHHLHRTIDQSLMRASFCSLLLVCVHQHDCVRSLCKSRILGNVFRHQRRSRASEPSLLTACVKRNSQPWCEPSQSGVGNVLTDHLQDRLRTVCLQDAQQVNTFKHRMNTLAYGEAMMAAARDYGEVCFFSPPQ